MKGESFTQLKANTPNKNIVFHIEKANIKGGCDKFGKCTF